MDNFEPSCSLQGGNDIIVQWQSPLSGCATIDTLSGDMDTIIAVFDECPANGGAELACSDDFSFSIYESELFLDVVQNAFYCIGIDSWSYDVAATYILAANIEEGISCP